MPKTLARFGLLALLFGVACAPVSPTSSPSAQRTRSDGAPTEVKTITLAQANAVKAYAPWDFDNTQGGGAWLADVHTQGLVTTDAEGKTIGRLATSLPSLDDGTVVLLPDGRMRTTWKLRPDVRWHDGAPFTSSDLVMSWRIMVHPELQSSLSGAGQRIETIDTPDPQTAVITWKSVFYRAMVIESRDLWPYPQHLLADAFEGDKDAFRSLPYFTTEYVNVGPFRLVDFGLGEHQVFDRFDDYFLGRPKADRMIIRTIPDPNVALANLTAGAVDIVSEKTLPLDLGAQLRDEWAQTGAATLAIRQDNWRYLWFQFDPQFARPIEMSQDVRIRRGMLHGLDREALRQFLFPGFPNTSGDTFMETADPRSPIVGQPFARYPYDPERAAQELASAGWVRGADGRVVNRNGESIQIELRGVPFDAKEVALVAENWRGLGLDVKENIQSVSVQRDAELKSKFPGIETRARSAGDSIFVSFDGRLHSRAENRWQGANTAHYANPLLDSLIDKLQGTLDVNEQGLVLREMGELMATDLPAMPMYFRTTFAAIGKGVKALEDYSGTRGPGLLSRSAHLWERL
ncbi:MAG: hypothetical protein HW416_1972 [Chloroflexi bacterium]|nr:hypothetical protein [Chloroflexota bacterium]